MLPIDFGEREDDMIATTLRGSEWRLAYWSHSGLLVRNPLPYQGVRN